MYIKSGTQNREKFVDVHKIAIAVGSDTCCALPGMHSFTGCDAVSAFGGKEKLGAVKLEQKKCIFPHWERLASTKRQLQRTSRVDLPNYNGK